MSQLTLPCRHSESNSACVSIALSEEGLITSVSHSLGWEKVSCCFLICMSFPMTNIEHIFIFHIFISLFGNWLLVCIVYHYFICMSFLKMKEFSSFHVTWVKYFPNCHLSFLLVYGIFYKKNFEFLYKLINLFLYGFWVWGPSQKVILYSWCISSAIYSSRTFIVSFWHLNVWSIWNWY